MLNSKNNRVKVSHCGDIPQQLQQLEACGKKEPRMFQDVAPDAAFVDFMRQIFDEMIDQLVPGQGHFSLLIFFKILPRQKRQILFLFISRCFLLFFSSFSSSSSFSFYFAFISICFIIFIFIIFLVDISEASHRRNWITDTSIQSLLLLWFWWLLTTNSDFRVATTISSSSSSSSS